MNLRQIRYFCAVVDAGSAVLAAERLFVAPTAISMQLGQLERHLGGELLDRSRRPMELTTLGKFFYPRARELLANASRLDEEAQDIATGKRNWLGIGFTRTAIFSVLPAAIRRFREVHPDVHLELLEVLSEYQPAQLRDGRIDIGISRFIGPAAEAPGLRHALMFDDPFVAAVPAGHALARRASLSGAELGGLPFILYPKDAHSPFGQQMLAALKLAGGNPAVGYEAVEIHTALALVGAGLGATLVGRSIVENNRADVAFLPVHDLETGTSVVAVSRSGETGRLAAAFLDLLVSAGDGGIMRS